MDIFWLESHPLQISARVSERTKIKSRFSDRVKELSDNEGVK